MSGLVGRHRHGVEMVVDPQRIPRTAVGVRREIAHHRPVLLDGNVDEIQPPTLRNEKSEAHGLRLYDVGKSVRKAFRSPGLRDAEILPTPQICEHRTLVRYGVAHTGKYM
jgi:hypothetical protein